MKPMFVDVCRLHMRLEGLGASVLGRRVGSPMRLLGALLLWGLAGGWGAVPAAAQERLGLFLSVDSKSATYQIPDEPLRIAEVDTGLDCADA